MSVTVHLKMENLFCLDEMELIRSPVGVFAS